MSLILPDLTSDLSTTTGTGTYTLAGTPTDYAPFGFSGFADGDTFYCSVIDVDPTTLVPTGNGAEVGLYTLGGIGTTLARTTIHRSTNANAAVNWAAGTRLIQVVRPAAGTLVILQPGGTAGTDEGRISHDGTDLSIQNADDGSVYVDVGPNNRTLRVRRRDEVSRNLDFIPDTSGTGSALNTWSDFAFQANAGSSQIFLRGTRIVINDAAHNRDVGFKRGAARVLALQNGQNDDAGATLSSLPISPSQITADQNDYAPGNAARFYRLGTDASRTITGLSVGQVDGQECEIWNVGSNNIVLAHDSASSSAANRFLIVGGADITLAANEMAFLRWFALEQSGSGAWRVVKG